MAATLTRAAGISLAIALATAGMTRADYRIYKLDVPSGQVTSFSSGSAGGVYIAAGDVDGDGYADLLTVPASGSPGEVSFRKGWDGSVKGSGFTAIDSDGDELGGSLAIGSFHNGPTATGGGVLVGGKQAKKAARKAARANSSAQSLTFSSSPPSGFTPGTTISPFDFDAVNGVSVAIDSTATDEVDMVTAAESAPDFSAGKKNYVGHVTLIKQRTGEVIRKFEVPGTTYGGGMKVAAGDLNGDGVSEIVTLMRNQTFDAGTGRTSDCLMATVMSKTGETLLQMPWTTAQETTVAPDGEMTGNLTIGDLNGDGHNELILTKATANGPLCSSFDFSTNAAKTWVIDSTAPIVTDFAGLPTGGDLQYTALGVAWSGASFGNPNGGGLPPILFSPPSTLVFSAIQVPEPTAIAALAMAALPAVRRRRRR